jgi:hypothetical protein
MSKQRRDFNGFANRLETYPLGGNPVTAYLLQQINDEHSRQ